VDEAEGELKDIVDCIKNRTKYHDLGGRIPKGVCSWEPAGTGKDDSGSPSRQKRHVPFSAGAARIRRNVRGGVGRPAANPRSVPAGEAKAP